MWNRVIVLPLCACLLAAGSAQGAENQVLSVGASETERLRDLLSRKRIDAFFADGTHLRGRIKEIQDGFLTVDIKKSTGPIRWCVDFRTSPRIGSPPCSSPGIKGTRAPFSEHCFFWAA